MTDLLNDELYNKILSSEDEDYIFDTFFPLIPKMHKNIKENPNNLLILARRFFNIINKILTMFLTGNDIKVLPDEKKNEILNVKSCTELIVNKLSNDDINLNEKELIDSMNIVFEFFNKLNEDQKLLGESLNKINNTLDQGTKDLAETIILKKISDYCVDNYKKSNDEIDFKQIDIYYNQIITMIKGFDKDIINDTLTNLELPENKPENVNKIKAYNMVRILKILIDIKKRNELTDQSK